jgi:hypothetical protein
MSGAIHAHTGRGNVPSESPIPGALISRSRVSGVDYQQHSTIPQKMASIPSVPA